MFTTLWCIEIYVNIIENNEKHVHYAKLTNPLYDFKLDFQKVEQQTGGKWLIHGTKHHKGIQLQSLEHPFRISY